jgi:hypothetical protein
VTPLDPLSVELRTQPDAPCVAPPPWRADGRRRAFRAAGGVVRVGGVVFCAECGDPAPEGSVCVPRASPSPRAPRCGHGEISCHGGQSRPPKARERWSHWIPCLFLPDPGQHARHTLNAAPRADAAARRFCSCGEPLGGDGDFSLARPPGFDQSDQYGNISGGQEGPRGGTASSLDSDSSAPPSTRPAVRPPPPPSPVLTGQVSSLPSY